MNETNRSPMVEAINDIVSEAERWDNVRTLVLTTNTVVIKDARASEFSRMVTGYIGDYDGSVTAEWEGRDFVIQFGESR